MPALPAILLIAALAAPAWAHAQESTAEGAAGADPGPAP